MLGLPKLEKVVKPLPRHPTMTNVLKAPVQDGLFQQELADSLGSMFTRGTRQTTSVQKVEEEAVALLALKQQIEQSKTELS